MKPAASLTLVGAGRMGSALLDGWLKGPAREISVIEPSPRAEIKALADAGRIHLNPAPSESSIIVLAVKPQQFPAVSDQAKAFVGPKSVAISIMAGVRLAQLARRLGTDRVIRAMPNTPGAIGKGVTAFTAPSGAKASDLAAARELLAPLGDVHGPVDEAMMPAVTALSGSGPAYIFLLAEVMAEAGIAQGLPRDLALSLARRTVEGAAALMAQSGDSPEALRKAVTSPGGTTQAALDILMDTGGMPALFRNALSAAATRDRQLSQEAD
jgi:pyrroline-5-carboxylate reductase